MGGGGGGAPPGEAKRDRRTFLRSLSFAPFWSGLKGRSLPDMGRGLPGIGRGRSSASAEASADRRSLWRRPSDRPAADGRKAVLISMLPKDISYAQRFAMARDAGFDAIEMQTIARADEAAEIREAATDAGLRIHSVMNADHWRLPLATGPPPPGDHSVAGVGTSLRQAEGGGAGGA